MKRTKVLTTLVCALALVGCEQAELMPDVAVADAEVEEPAPSAVAAAPTPVKVAAAAPKPKAPAPDPIKALIGQPKAEEKRADKKARRVTRSSAKTFGIGAVGTRGRGSGTGYGAGVSGLGTRGVGAGGGAAARGLSGLGTGRGRVSKRVALGGRAKPPPPPKLERSKFVDHGVNGWTDTLEDRHSTFAADVDSGSYTFARRFLERGRLPNQSGVRVEEWINAFSYDYAGPEDGHPFRVHLAAAPSPVNEAASILRVGIQGKRISNQDRKPAHITFLVDVSGSMQSADKLPLAQRAMQVLVDNLNSRDSVAIATYAGRDALVLPATRATRAGKTKILSALSRLKSGGGTNMGSGMELAYREANKHLGSGRVSRVVVLSDGDANIGRTGHGAILKSIKGYVSEGITLSTVGFGTGNYNDHLMEQLANAGNGNYSYIDSERTARRVFGEQITGTLEVIAKDVKIQVEFDRRRVERYRLIGYENRDVADKDFRNDKVDAGEIGAGHTVTALYEVVTRGPATADMATVRLRYKQPRGTKAREVTHALPGANLASSLSKLDANTRFAVGVALAAEIFRGSPHVGDRGLNDALKLLESGSTGIHKRQRDDFVKLIRGLTRRDLLVRR